MVRKLGIALAVVNAPTLVSYGLAEPNPRQGAATAFLDYAAHAPAVSCDRRASPKGSRINRNTVEDFFMNVTPGSRLSDTAKILGSISKIKIRSCHKTGIVFEDKTGTYWIDANKSGNIYHKHYVGFAEKFDMNYSKFIYYVKHNKCTKLEPLFIRYSERDSNMIENWAEYIDRTIRITSVGEAVTTLHVMRAYVDSPSPMYQQVCTTYDAAIRAVDPPPTFQGASRF